MVFFLSYFLVLTKINQSKRHLLNVKLQSFELFGPTVLKMIFYNSLWNLNAIRSKFNHTIVLRLNIQFQINVVMGLSVLR